MYLTKTLSSQQKLRKIKYFLMEMSNKMIVINRSFIKTIFVRQALSKVNI